MKKIYKTTIASAKKQKVVSIITPDDNNEWELFSITVNKNKIYYHWIASIDYTIQKSVFASSDEDFKRTLDLVQESPDSQTLNEEIK